MFEMILRHWFLLFLSFTLYCFLFFDTVRRFHAVFAVKLQMLHKGSKARRFLVDCHVILMEFLSAPLLYFVLRKYDQDKMLKRKAEAEACQQDKEKSMNLENDRRRKCRGEWLIENQPVLYYKTMNGITAVVRPADYERCLVETKRAIRNGCWESESTLMPILYTHLFLHETGRKHLCQVFNSAEFPACASGWLSDLDDIVGCYNVILVYMENIFVPFVNETILPYSGHICSTESGEKLRFELIESQAPQELQPVHL